MVDRLGRMPTYGGQAGSGMVDTRVPQPTVDFDLTGIVAGYYRARQEQAAQADGVRSVKAETQFQTDLLKHQTTLDPMSETYADDLLAWSEENGRAAAEAAGFETEAARRDFSARTTRFTGAAIQQNIVDRYKAVQQDAIVTREDAEQETLAAIRSDPANVEKYLADFGAKTPRLNGAIPGKTRERMDRKFADEATLVQAEGMAEGGDLAGARALIRSAPLPPERARAIEGTFRRIENEREAERSRAVTAQLASAYDTIDAKQISDPGYMDQPEFAELKQVNPMGWASARQTIRNNAERRVAEQRRMADQSRKIAEGRGAGYSQDASNDAWGLALTDMQQQNAPMTDYMQKLEQHVAAYGMVPGEAKKRLQAADMSGDVDQLVEASAVEGILHETFPNLEIGSRPIYSEIRGYMDAGMQHRDAVMKAVENRKADPKIAELRKAELPAAVKDARYTPRASLAEALDLSPDELPPALVQRFDDEVRRSYASNGSMEIAQKAAADRVKKTFLPGRTTIGGAERFVEYAPEAFLAQSIPNAKVLAPHIGEAITQHLTDTLKALPGLKPPYAEGAGNEWAVEHDIPPIKLEASPTTRKQIEAGARPEYDIYVRDIGGWRKLQDAKGNPVTYPLPDHDTLMAYPVMQAEAGKLKAQAERADTRRKAVDTVREAMTPGPGNGQSVRDTMRGMWGITK